MEDHLKHRPAKLVFKQDKINKLKAKAIQKIQADFLPNSKILQIILIGSAVKNTFGEYNPPGFRGSLFSDFDFIFFVEDAYKIPTKLPKQPDAKPFPKDSLNLAYRIKNYIDNRYDAEIFFIKTSSLQDPKIQKLGESAGIPMSTDSKHPYQVIYAKPTTSH